MKIRVVRTASNARAVQVVSYHQNKRIVLHHLGSAHNDEELNNLRLLAEEWIKDYSRQLSIFPEQNPNNVLLLNHTSFIGVRYNYYYRQMSAILKMIGLGSLPPLLLDLTIIRIFEPASKLRSLELLDVFFGISHNRKSYYRIAPQCRELKETVIEKIADGQIINHITNKTVTINAVTSIQMDELITKIFSPH